MESSVRKKLAALAVTREEEDRAVSDLHRNMSRFLKKKEKVLLLYPKEDNPFCRIWEGAILACGCVPLWLEDDHRWITMLKSAFTSKSTCLVGSALTLLGLSKLSKQLGTPLYAKNVLMTGSPAAPWLVNGVRQGLDCMVWGCPDADSDGGITHMDVQDRNPELTELHEKLLQWSSILDCRMAKTEYGLELELVAFPGEKLPKLPTAAKRIVRAFNPETDEPFTPGQVQKKWLLQAETH